MAPRVRCRVGGLTPLGAAAWLLTLGGCDNRQASPPADPYQPSRPTNAGSLTDALRRTPGRVLRPGGTPVVPASSFPTPPSPSEHLDEATRGVVEQYLVTLTRVNTTLRSVGDPALASDALERLSPLVDQWRASMDYLSMVPESAQAEIRREFGEQLGDASRGLDEQVRRLADRPAFGALLTLVRDVPTLAGTEPTPAPQAIHADAGTPPHPPE